MSDAMRDALDRLNPAGRALHQALLREQVDEFFAVVKERQAWTPSGWHINYGESEDRMRGYNRAWDDRAASKPYAPTEEAPEDEPFRRAYVAGYEEGWYDYAHQDDEDDDGDSG